MHLGGGGTRLDRVKTARRLPMLCTECAAIQNRHKRPCVFHANAVRKWRRRRRRNVAANDVKVAARALRRLRPDAPRRSPRAPHLGSRHAASRPGERPSSVAHQRLSSTSPPRHYPARFTSATFSARRQRAKKRCSTTRQLTGQIWWLTWRPHDGMLTPCCICLKRTVLTLTDV